MQRARQLDARGVEQIGRGFALSGGQQVVCLSRSPSGGGHIRRGLDFAADRLELRKLRAEQPARQPANRRAL